MTNETTTPGAPLDLAIHSRRSTATRPLAGFGPALQWGLREHFRSAKLLRRLGIALALGFLGSLLVTRVPERADGRDAVHRLWAMFDEHLLVLLLPLIALLIVGPMFSREQRQRTLVYHLVRPIARTTLFLARYLAGLLAAWVVATVLLLSTLFFARIELPASVWLAMPAFAAAAMMALGAVYYVLSALFRRGLIVGLIYTFVIEGIVANLPGTIQKFSVGYFLKSLYHGMTDAAFAERSEQVARITREGRTIGEGITAALLIPYEPPGTAALALVAVAVALLAIGAWRIARRDFALKD